MYPPEVVFDRATKERLAKKLEGLLLKAQKRENEEGRKLAKTLRADLEKLTEQGGSARPTATLPCWKISPPTWGIILKRTAPCF